MASTIIKFPTERTENKRIITAYKVAGGEELIAFDTERTDQNNHKIAGISLKPVGADRYENIIDLEKWKQAKSLMVDDLHGKKENFEYFVPAEEILVTEDYTHDIALRKENLDIIEKNYEEFLKIQQKEEAVIEQENNVPTAEPTPAPVVEEPTIVPTEIASETIEQENSVPTAEPTPAPVIEEPTIVPTEIASEAPVMESVVPTPVIEEEKTPEFPGIQNTMMEEHPINPSPISEESPIQETSAVSKYYADQLKAIESQCNEALNKCIELNTKYQNTLTEIGEKVVGILKEIEEKDKLSIENFNKSQQILAFQTEEDLSKNLTKAA